VGRARRGRVGRKRRRRSGSYEPRDRTVMAIEPSRTMIEKRPEGAAPVIQGSAEALPLESDSVDAAMAVFTIHHWQNIRRGLAELRRVARHRVVILTWDKSFAGSFWLTRDYVPELEEWTVAQLPTIDEIETQLGSVKRRSLPVPRDCRDGFLRAYWGRPEAYLEQHVRKNISQFNLVDPAAVERGIDHLAGICPAAAGIGGTDTCAHSTRSTSATSSS
jgi:SAM-dependent methyltransferase